jgi:hypothetical protein
VAGFMGYPPVSSLLAAAIGPLQLVFQSERRVHLNRSDIPPPQAQPYGADLFRPAQRRARLGNSSPPSATGPIRIGNKDYPLVVKRVLMAPSAADAAMRSLRR